MPEIRILDPREPEGYSITILTGKIAEGTAYPIASKLGDLKGADMVINVNLSKVKQVEDTRRFVGYGKQLVLFLANTEDFDQHTLISHLVWLDKVTMVVHSQHHYDSVIKALAWFNPSLRRRMADNVHLIWGGVEDVFVSTGNNSRDRWIVPYNRYNRAQKDIDRHLQIIALASSVFAQKGLTVPKQEFYVGGYKGMPDPDHALDASGLYTIIPQPKDRGEYLDNARKAGMFLCTSKFESLGLMYLELLMSGCVGVFIDKPWVRKLLPNYPYLAKDDHEAVSMLLYVYENYDTVRDTVLNDTCSFISEQRSHNTFVKGLLDFVTGRFDDGSTK